MVRDLTGPRNTMTMPINVLHHEERLHPQLIHYLLTHKEAAEDFLDRNSHLSNIVVCCSMIAPWGDHNSVPATTNRQRFSQFGCSW